ncbi:hypothetical protein BS17DRAFT_765639 [Gyrodon lividus]|nr:hypothetical protein BS17DRAFT_765639 [Gyrodon lividus]
MDVDVFMDTSQDFDADAVAVVRWVASQSPNPALQALMNEAEREKRTRPATPVFVEPLSWTPTLTSTSSAAAASSSTVSSSNSKNNNTTRTSPPSLSIDSTSTSTSSALHTHGSGPSTSKRVEPSFAQRKPLSASTSNQAVRPSISARPRSSSHSVSASSSKSSTSKGRYKSPEDEPKAVTFLALLKDISRQVDENSRKKQRLAVRKREKVWERSLCRSGVDDRMGLETDSALDSAQRVLTKTSCASSTCPSDSSGKTLGRTMSASASNPGSHGRVLTKTASLGAPGFGLGPGSSTPTSVSCSYLSRDLKLNSAPRVLTKACSTSTISNTDTRVAHNVDTLETSSNDGESNDGAMNGTVVDFNATGAEWEKNISFGRATCADTTIPMQVDDGDSDIGMDVSFFQRVPPQPRPPPQYRVPVPTPPSQANVMPRQPVPTQRPRMGPPPLGMRRPPQFQFSQYSLSQTSKSATVPRFKSPLLANGSKGGDRGGSGAKPATTTFTLKQPPRSVFTKQGDAEAETGGAQDPDSSFDVSFDVDGDALEEAMKAYD